MDSTRDGYDDESGYTEGFWNYLKVEGYAEKDGSITEYAFLCDSNELTYRMVQDYYAGNTSPEWKNLRYGIFISAVFHNRNLKSAETGLTRMIIMR